MPNKLFQQLNSSNSSQPQRLPLQNGQINQIKTWINQLKGMTNPNEGLKMLVAQNPQLQQVMNLVQQSGGNPQQAFMQVARMRGIDPNQIISMLK